MDLATVALFDAMAAEYDRESVRGILALVICNAAETLPSAERVAFWQAWQAAKDAVTVAR